MGFNDATECKLHSSLPLSFTQHTRSMHDMVEHNNNTVCSRDILKQYVQTHPRRRRGSQSGQENQKGNESFQEWVKEGLFHPSLKTFVAFSPAQTDCSWVSKDGANQTQIHVLMYPSLKIKFVSRINIKCRCTIPGNPKYCTSKKAST